jgi:hypothetical protein
MPAEMNLTNLSFPPRAGTWQADSFVPELLRQYRPYLLLVSVMLVPCLYVHHVSSRVRLVGAESSRECFLLQILLWACSRHLRDCQFLCLQELILVGNDYYLPGTEKMRIAVCTKEDYVK